MLRSLGFGFVSTEVITWVVAAIGMIAAVAAWVCDAILGEVAFGMIGNWIVLFFGCVGALVGFNYFIAPIQHTDPTISIAVGTGGGFAAVLLLAVVKRLASR